MFSVHQCVDFLYQNILFCTFELMLHLAAFFHDCIDTVEPYCEYETLFRWKLWMLLNFWFLLTLLVCLMDADHSHKQDLSALVCAASEPPQRSEEP